MKPCFVISHSDEFRVSTWLYLWPGETTILRFGARKFVRVIDHSPRILIPPVFLFFELRRVSRQSWKFSRMLGGICTKGSDYVRAVCRYGHPLEDTPLSKLLWDCNEAMTAAWYRITSLSLTWEKYSHIRVYQRGPFLHRSIHHCTPWQRQHGRYKVLDRAGIEICHFGYRDAIIIQRRIHRDTLDLNPVKKNYWRTRRGWFIIRLSD